MCELDERDCVYGEMVPIGTLKCHFEVMDVLISTCCGFTQRPQKHVLACGVD